MGEECVARVEELELELDRALDHCRVQGATVADGMV
jgi:hypothetical protein